MNKNECIEKSDCQKDSHDKERRDARIAMLQKGFLEQDEPMEIAYHQTLNN